ncbi:LppM family (lipo)protein [Cutibacterium sp. V947]|uniref:LppM family (lipo)protein n=1 Tax=Cutibacterium sp. V947 TaxID=3446480 RepID=UPI003EE24CB7
MQSVSRHLRRCLAVLLAPLLLLAGCVKFDTAMEIKDEDHIHVKATVGISKSMADMSGEDLTSQFSDCDDTKGVGGGTSNAKGEKFEDDQYIGCTYSGDVTAAEYNKGNEGSKVTFDRDKVTFKMNNGYFDGAGGSTESLDASMFSDFKVSIIFPGKVLNHSGSSKVDGNTVTWTDPKDMFSSEGLSATGERNNGVPTWVWIVVAVSVLAIIGVVVAVLFKKKGQRASKPENGDTPWAMQYPGQPQGNPQAQQPPYQSPSQSDQPWGHVPGNATGAAQPDQQPPSHPDDFWKNHGSS